MKDESSMRETMPEQAFIVSSYANTACMPENQEVYSDFETAVWSVTDTWNREDPDFPFYEKTEDWDNFTEEELKKCGETLVLACLGEHALGGVTMSYVDDHESLKEMWDEEEGDWHHYC